MLNVDEYAAVGEHMYRLLKGRQIDTINEILNSCRRKNMVSRCNFIDGPEVRETVVYKAFYYILTGRNYFDKCMAYTRIASILLPDGRSFHKTFVLKVPLTPESISKVILESSKAKKLVIFLFNGRSTHITRINYFVALVIYLLEARSWYLVEIFVNVFMFNHVLIKKELIDLSVKNFISVFH